MRLPDGWPRKKIAVAGTITCSACIGLILFCGDFHGNRFGQWLLQGSQAENPLNALFVPRRLKKDISLDMNQVKFKVLPGSANVQVTATWEFQVGAGDTQSWMKKSIATFLEMPPLNVKAVNGQGVALKASTTEEGDAYYDTITWVTVEMATPVTGPAKHKVILTFDVNNGLCSHDGKALLPAHWLSKWRLPVEKTEIGIDLPQPSDASLVCFNFDFGDVCGTPKHTGFGNQGFFSISIPATAGVAMAACTDKMKTAGTMNEDETGSSDQGSGKISGNIMYGIMVTGFVGFFCFICGSAILCPGKGGGSGSGSSGGYVGGGGGCGGGGGGGGCGGGGGGCGGGG